MAEVEIMPARVLPRTEDEAHWLRLLRIWYPVRHRGPFTHRVARHYAKMLREKRNSYKEKSP